MKKRSFYSFMLASVMTLAASVVTGCTEHEDSPVEISPQLIVINYTDTVVDIQPSPVSGTRSQSASSVLTNKSGKKMYLSCTESPWPTDNGARTRGAKVTTASISSLGVCASVYLAANTYTSAGCGSYFYKESVSSGTPTSYYWPTAGYKISFFAYYPYNNAAFTVQSAANVTGAPTYAYTVPSVISNQLDIMTGQVTDQLGGSSSAVNMSLVHRCSAIHFNITNDRSDAITVNSISIEGVKYTGTLNESTWTLGSGVNSSSTNPFTLTCNTSVAAGVTTDITGSSNIFLMLPQALPSGAKLKVVVNDEEFETDLSGTWVAGKEYTYTITMNELGPIDLSMVDNAGNARASITTANCYLVHKKGDYIIPLVYGNAIKNGADNRVAYYPGEESSIAGGLNQFVNHNGDGITGPWITKSGTGVDAGMGITVDGAELLWQDTQSLVTAVSIDGDYLKFTVGSFNEGNAVIAVKSGATVVWSWHIWATEDDLSGTTVVSTGSHNYTVAPVNLGWVPTGGEGKQGRCPYYQWGRKDAFVPAKDNVSGLNATQSNLMNGIATIYDINNSNITPASSVSTTSKGLQLEYVSSTPASSALGIANNIKNPIRHYHSDDDASPIYFNLWDAQNTSINNVTTATKKTVYDPCPPDFCVPTSNLAYYIGGNANPDASSNVRVDTNWDSTNKGKTWNLDGADIYFPFVGRRNYQNYGLGLYYVGQTTTLWVTTIYRYIKNKKYVYSGCRQFGAESGKWTWAYFNSCHENAIRPVAEE